MSKIRRLLKRVRTPASMLVAAIVALAVWMPQAATADPVDGRYSGLGERGFDLEMPRGSTLTVLIEVELPGGATASTYCIELETVLARSAPMTESTWAAFPGSTDAAQHAARVNWIVNHSYPKVGVGSLESILTSGGATLHDGLSAEEAITATQAAIWHFTDEYEPERPDVSDDADEDEDADVLALYDYLVGPANVGAPEAAPALAVEESSAAGQAARPIGPFHVRTTAATYDVELDDLPAGTEITDAEGRVMDPADLTDSSEFHLVVPAGTPAGDGDATVQATAPLATGRVMFATNYQEEPSQSLIVASSPTFAISEAVHVSWTEAQVRAGNVTVAGYPVVGETVTAGTTGWEPDSVELTYRWLRDGEPIKGADGSTYTLSGDDDGHTISVRVVGSAPRHLDAERTSDDVDVTSGELELSDDEPETGDDVTVDGDGFAPDTEYALEIRSTPVDIGRVTTDGAGTFSEDVEIPDGADPGDHEIVLVAESGVVAASVDLEIQEDGDGDGIGGLLPDTGGLPLAVLAVAGVLVVVGARTLRLRRNAALAKAGSGRRLVE